MTTLTPDFEQLLDSFLASPLSRQWLSTPQLLIYVRKGKRVIRAEVVPVLDIGDVTVTESLRGQGLFKQVLAAMLSRCVEQYRGVYVENVHNPDLRSYLCKLAADDPEHCGWIEPLACFYRLAAASS